MGGAPAPEEGPAVLRRQRRRFLLGGVELGRGQLFGGGAVGDDALLQILAVGTCHAGLIIDPARHLFQVGAFTDSVGVPRSDHAFVQCVDHVEDLPFPERHVAAGWLVVIEVSPAEIIENGNHRDWIQRFNRVCCIQDYLT